MKLIIPSAKVVMPEMQNIGELPPIIFPINDNIPFDYFKMKYELSVSEINVICYEKEEIIKEKLNHYKLKTKLKFITLNKLGDLGESIYEGLSDDDSEVIINFADTVILDLPSLADTDYFCGYKSEYTHEWTYYSLSNGRLNNVIDKKEDIELQGIGDIFVGVFKISNGAFFKQCLERTIKDEIIKKEGIDSFYNALIIYSNKYPLKEYQVKEWFDIGHYQKYHESRAKIREREFNEIKIDDNRGILKKTSEDIDKFLGEIRWYLKLPEKLEYVHPRIYNYSLNYDNPYVSMEYYSYHTLHELFLYSDLKKEQWERIIDKIVFVMSDFSKFRYNAENSSEILKEMYLNKTFSRLEKLRGDANFKDLFDSRISINGENYCSLNEIMKILNKIIPQELFNVTDFCIIHGDLCFTNIMIDDNLTFIKLIDPRGSFGECDIYGDSRYEVAKLLHSVEGKYDYIIKDLFELDRTENSFKYNIFEPRRSFDLRKLFRDKIVENMDFDMSQVELIEALLFFSMIPLHKENVLHQYAMLCTGMSILNKVVNIKEQN